MCGIAGIFDPGGLPDGSDRIVAGMRDRLTHRGPDSAGLWLDADAGIALGHRRLSIIDLSPSGHQPMQSPSGRFHIAFNGEIYNHLHLRKRSEDAGWGDCRGHSDTESLLAHIDLFGLERTLQESVGMFAIALWDRETLTLHLARDRMGEKPLYYGLQRGVLLFGSELKALRAHPSFEAQIDNDVVPLYLRYGYIPAPWSVWHGIRKLLPGTVATFTADTHNQLPTPKPYWSLMDVAQAGQREPFEGSDDDAIAELQRVLKMAIAGQMVADVPLGAFLSGGIDSSTVVALMQSMSDRSIRTFSIGFEEEAYNEAHHARAVATHLGTDHTELIVTAKDAQDVVPLLPSMLDEPFGDSSAIPTYLVARLARQHVTVSLSGDGGDELFAGYKRYGSTVRTYTGTHRLPRSARLLAFGTADSLASAALAASTAITGPSSGLSRRLAVTALRARLVREVAASSSLAKAYSSVVGQWPEVNRGDPTHVAQARSTLEYAHSPFDSFHQLMAIDSHTYLPDDILTKVDRTAMAVSLETRVPLLDHRVVELAWRLPLKMKVRDGVGKWVLRQVLGRHVPPAMFERPKMGFGVPVGDWIRGPMRDWAESLLSERALERDGLLPTGAIRDGWQRHLRGDPGWRDKLWTVLMWQAWRANA
jgi:asparagine synthase (glutamine-hydrolysing)